MIAGFGRFESLLPASRRWRRLLPALLTACASAELFAYGGYGAVERARAAQVELLTERVRAEQGSLRAWLRDTSASGGPAGTAPLQRTDVLRVIDAVALQSGARIVRLVPRPGSPAALEVDMNAGLPGFAQFAAEMERRQGALHNVQVRRSEATGVRRSELFISFVLDAPRLAAPRGEAPPSAGWYGGDPFAPLSASAAASRAGHRLTGITRIGDEWLATIDGRDYREGDSLGGARVAAIRDDAVQLASGPVRYWLRFGPKSN